MNAALKQDVFLDKKVSLGLVYLFIIWLVVFWQGFTTALDIWLESDIFNHCLFVIPGTFFLIYLKRQALDGSLFKPNYWLLPILVGTLLLYALGLAGDVQLFMHVATFSFLPLIIWCYLGNKLAYQIVFPLCFILFAIPFGEEFVPFLQEVTADWSVALLNLTGVPIYRSGLYIEIPQGRFLVAEACSGISFFIVSVVIGSLYTYLNIVSWKRKVTFVIISICFPVLANAVRVYGIILTGYLTDMEHAVGADHLIYGWVFFMLVIICLLVIGEFIREKNIDGQVNPERISHNPPIYTRTILPITSMITTLAVVFSIWFFSILNHHNPDSVANNIHINHSQLLMEKSEYINLQWEPKFKEPFDIYRGYLSENKIDVFMVWYPKGRGELISSLNRLYSEKNWTLSSRKNLVDLEYDTLQLETIVNSQRERLLTYWYVVDGKIFADKKFAKLYEILNILLGQHIGSGLVAVSMQTEQVNSSADRRLFKKVVETNITALSSSFQFN